MPLFVCATLVSSTSLWTRGKGPMASLGGCRAQHAAFLRRIRDVQRGSPPQADAEGLVVDSPQDEGCPGRMQCAPTYIRRDGAAERCRGLGCPQNLESPPKNGGQEVDDHRLERGPGGFRGHDGAWPSEERSGFPLPVFTRTGCVGMTEEGAGILLCRGFWGCPPFL